ncbi:MAG: hypothetical protein QM756_11020 [Polyangiaceae bacterium]
MSLQRASQLRDLPPVAGSLGARQGVNQRACYSVLTSYGLFSKLAGAGAQSGAQRFIP